MKRLSKLIDEIVYEDDAPRDYIGASSIGSECLRQIWYEYTNVESTAVSNKIRRTWQIGHLLEEFVIELLGNSGIDVECSQTGMQDSELPYFQGHVDGIIPGRGSVLEIKTAKDSSFNVFLKDGCKKWNIKYYAQLQAYMGMSGLNSAYIVVLNKDNSDIFDEFVTFDADYYESLKEKARLIHDAKIPPPRINGSPMFYMCKMCRFRGVCHG